MGSVRDPGQAAQSSRTSSNHSSTRLVGTSRSGMEASGAGVVDEVERTVRDQVGGVGERMLDDVRRDTV